MSIIFETQIDKLMSADSSEAESLVITQIFERGDYRNRKSVFNTCLQKVIGYYSSRFQLVTLILPYVQVEDTKVNRHLGIWSILEKQFKISIPNRKRSEFLNSQNGKLVFSCMIELSISEIGLISNFLSIFRNSFLVFGDPLPNSKMLKKILDESGYVHDTDPKAWIPLMSYFVKQSFYGVRLFGQFDDTDNGVFVYEPISAYNAFGDWKVR